MPIGSSIQRLRFQQAFLLSPTNGREHQTKMFLSPHWHHQLIPRAPLELALARFGAAVAARQGIEQSAGSPAGAS